MEPRLWVWSLVLQGVTLLLMGLLLPLWRHVQDIRRNDLRHIDGRLDRIEKKLDEHLQYHLEHEGPR